MPRFIDAILRNPNTQVFRRVGVADEQPDTWELEPLEDGLLADSGSDSFYIIKAINIRPDKSTLDCYMDICFPERINDFAYFVSGDVLQFSYLHEFPGEIIPAQAIDCFGVYELFYSRIAPEVGIEVMRRGLAVANRKQFIAEDLGYILRDERRIQEAAAMFRLAAEGKPSSYFIYAEAASAFAEIGDMENVKLYEALFKWEEAGIEDRLTQASELLDSAAAAVVAMSLTRSQWDKVEQRFADSLARPGVKTLWEQVKARAQQWDRRTT